MSASASIAGAIGGCPRSAGRYRFANSCCNASLKSSCRCSRKKTNSLAFRTRFTMCSSCSDSSTGGCQDGGCMFFPPFECVFLELTMLGLFCQPHPFHFLTDALVQLLL